MIRRLTETKLPQTLYKYRDWSNKFHRKLISNQELYFAKPSDFNDPFDGNIPVRWDLMTEEDCFDKNLELLNTVHKDKDQEKVREYAWKVTKDKTLWHPEKLNKETSEQINKWGTLIGLLALSSVRNNILMWSHYANNHEGFTVGLDANSLASKYDFDYIEPINYQLDYPTTVSGLDDTTEQFHKKSFYKSDLWEHEKEWRVSKNHIEKRTVKLNPETITEIIIGCCTNPKEEADIVKMSKKKLGNQIEIFKAVKSEEEFSLIMEKIN
ncbi:DUF2971 domain-containing protein [Psychroflexus sp. MES1-P1E]|uniref:DUF2971 domain-containing protein n=1 Tax=Psychroflexus sp. MES1-P1E TaxID=2058320 RepID=UPI000C7BF019|nr:DUF2971 domain-containing protein [Psychroflexus sp. MES1-P1E]PKG42620.1 hypothetical protein CXF67_09295 [Psychroflexus sp. MES1-P1E]